MLREVPKEPVTYDRFSSWEVPESDVPNIPTGRQLVPPDHPDLVSARSALRARDVTNAMVYGPMSAMFWHTNSNRPGTRVYYTFSLGDSVFRYRDPDTMEIREDWDDRGWTTREFDVTETNPLWHSVWTSCTRLSFGFLR
jgi:hypothetical protein